MVVDALDRACRRSGTSRYINNDFAARTWDEAAGQVLKGTAAMTIMGDWAKGYFQANDPIGPPTIGWEPSPGTTGIFKVVTDSFGLPKGAKNADNTENFLDVLASKTGQVTFNLRKGSIPARTDVDTSQFDVYMKDAPQTSRRPSRSSAARRTARPPTMPSPAPSTTAINTFIANPHDPTAAAATRLAGAGQVS